MLNRVAAWWELTTLCLDVNVDFSNGITLQMNIWKTNVSQETDLNMQMHFEYLEYIEYTNLYVGNKQMGDFSIFFVSVSTCLIYLLEGRCCQSGHLPFTISGGFSTSEVSFRMYTRKFNRNRCIHVCRDASLSLPIL